MIESVCPWYDEAAKTAVGFFWTCGWAFVLGYTISAMIQSFVPRGRLTQVKIDCTFWMNVVSVGVVGGQLYLHRQHRRMHEGGGQDDENGGGGLSVKRFVVYVFVAVLLGGLVAVALTGGTA